LNQNSLKNYTKGIPDEIVRLFKGLSDEKKIAIVAALIKDGDLTFNEIKLKFDFSSNTLSKNLKVLQDANLIENFVGRHNGRVASIYKVTPIPKLIFKSAFAILKQLEEPEIQIKPNASHNDFMFKENYQRPKTLSKSKNPLLIYEISNPGLNENEIS